MDNKLKNVADMVRNAEGAVSTLNEYVNKQIYIRGISMREQIAKYIRDTLVNANFIFCGCEECGIRLSDSNSCGEYYFSIKDNGCTFYMPVFKVDRNGEIHYIKEFNEDMTLRVARYWSDFTREFNDYIKYSLQMEQNAIMNKLANIDHKNKIVSEWTL